VATVSAWRRSADRRPIWAPVGRTGAYAANAAALAGLADRVDDILANESPEEAKELLRLLIKEIRVHNRRLIVPDVSGSGGGRAIRSKVELGGLEPPTSWVRSRRSPN
jgi:hypothetical protein